MDIAPIRMPAVGSLEATSTASKRPEGPSSGASFASLVGDALANVNATQGAAEAASHDFQLGRGDVSLEDAMISLQKANISFQTTVQVRNKLVAAYNDIMNMQL